MAGRWAVLISTDTPMPGIRATSLSSIWIERCVSLIVAGNTRSWVLAGELGADDCVLAALAASLRTVASRWSTAAQAGALSALAILMAMARAISFGTTAMDRRYRRSKLSAFKDHRSHWAQAGASPALAIIMAMARVTSFGATPTLARWSTGR